MKKFILFFAVALFAVSCIESEPVREASPEDIACGAYFLATDKANSINLPVDAVAAGQTEYTYYVGRTNNQGDLTVNLINHSDPCFTVPSTVTFKSGEYTAPLVITFTEVPPADTPVSIEIDPQFVSLYAAGSPKLNVALNCLWEDLGMGQFFDSFYMGIVAPVKITKSKVAPLRYRIYNAYTPDMYVGDDWYDASLLPEFIEITVADPDADGVQYVTWDKFFYIGCNYQGVAGQPIKAYLPSALSSSQAAGDAQSYVVEEGLIQISPYFYIDGVGGFGIYPLMISLPGGPSLE